MNNAYVYYPIFKSFPVEVNNFDTKKKTYKTKKSAMYKNGCLAATRMYSLRDKYKSVEIALHMHNYKNFEKKFHGSKIVPSGNDQVSTLVIQILCEKNWEDSFHRINQQCLKRPSII